MTAYRKKIEVTPTGMVIASVLSADGRCVGLSFFSGWAYFRPSPTNVKRNCNAAHKWADKMIKVCEDGEVMP